MMENETVIVENFDAQEDDKESMVVVETETEYSSTNDVPAAFTADISQEHGYLVAQILETQRELANTTTVDLVPSKIDSVREDLKNSYVIKKYVDTDYSVFIEFFFLRNWKEIRKSTERLSRRKSISCGQRYKLWHELRTRWASCSTVGRWFRRLYPVIDEFILYPYIFPIAHFNFLKELVHIFIFVIDV